MQNATNDNTEFAKRSPYHAFAKAYNDFMAMIPPPPPAPLGYKTFSEPYKPGEKAAMKRDCGTVY